MSPLWVSYRSMTSRFPPFAFVEMVSPYNKKNITRWLEDMNFMFSWQEQYLTRSLRWLVRYRSSHSNIKFISSRHRVISSIYEKMYKTSCLNIPCERRLHLVNFSSRICRRAFLGEEGGERWIRVRVFVANTDSRVFTVGCIINSSGEYTYLPRVE